MDGIVSVVGEMVIAVRKRFAEWTFSNVAKLVSLLKDT